VGKREIGRVQEEAVFFEPVIATVSIAWIVHNRMTNSRHVYANLVRTARF
jgi:hypothetical protein